MMGQGDLVQKPTWGGNQRAWPLLGGRDYSSDLSKSLELEQKPLAGISHGISWDQHTWREVADQRYSGTWGPPRGNP